MYDIGDVDVIALEGIYLMKRTFREYYDLALWVEWSFKTVLIRALRRAMPSSALGALRIDQSGPNVQPRGKDLRTVGLSLLAVAVHSSS